MTFLEAIGKMEGFGVPGSRPVRNNNPGDLEYHAWMEKHGAVLEPPVNGKARFAKFATLEDGYDCMKVIFRGPSYKGLTVAAALNRWAPPVENATNHYIASVCGWVPCNPTDVIDSLL